MKTVQISLLIGILLAAAAPDAAAQPTPVKWILTKECSLKVHGTTNVNAFTCSILSYPNPDTLYLYKGSVPSRDPIKISGLMSLHLEQFDCHNKVMTKDLLKTLKAKEFPMMFIRFLDLNQYPGNDPKQEVKGRVCISLAGVTKQYVVSYQSQAAGETELTLIGTKQIGFSDFDLEPPRKLGGMIRTNEMLQVEFTLKMRI